MTPKIVFEWKKAFENDSEKVYMQSLATLIGNTAADKLVEIARIYETYDWFRLLIAKRDGDVAGTLALYYEPIHGSHEGWICVNPTFREMGIGDQIQEEFERNALANGIRLFRADATLAYTHSQKYLFRRGYKAVGYTPASFSFLGEGNKSLGSAVTVWKIFDPELERQWREEEKETLDWENQRWKCE